MAQFTIYKSTDGGAPVLTGQVGKLLLVLDYALLNAGWTKPFTGTNKAAYKQGAGSNGMYVRVQDDAPGGAGAQETRMTGYEAMTTVDAGTNPFPTAAQGVGGIAMVTARKSTTADATARPWIVVADSRTFYLFVKSGDADSGAITTGYMTFGFGEFFSFVASDAYRVFIIGRDVENSVTYTQSLGRLTINTGATLVALSGHFLARGHTGLVGSVNVGKHGDGASLTVSLAFEGAVPYTNPEDGGLYLAPVWIHDPNTIPIKGVRGRMRGMWHFMHTRGSVNDLDTVNGSGLLAGKTFLFIFRVYGNSNLDTGTMCIETSNTLETN